MGKLIEIKNVNGSIIFSSDEFGTIKQVIEHCVYNEISLKFANFRNLDLDGTDFSGADVSFAHFRGSSLMRADFSCADVSFAHFRGSDLSYANFSDSNSNFADFRDSNSNFADFRDSNLGRADFSSANLSFANFTGAYLCNCKGNNKEIVTFKTEFYICNFTKDFLSIGCRTHTYEEWFNFSDDVISEMARDALEFWREYKEILKELKTKYGF